MKDLHEEFDFGTIENDNAEQVGLDDELKSRLDRIVHAFLFENESKFPYEDELDELPDHCWKPVAVEGLPKSKRTNMLGLTGYDASDAEATLNLLITRISNKSIPYTYPNLNWIDVSEIENMSYMFVNTNFEGDISRWDVSNVKNMFNMFEYSKFNGDISNWDVSNVKNMGHMFAYSSFDGDISDWDVSNVKSVEQMFSYSAFTGLKGDITKWDIHCKVNSMFFCCPFKGDLTGWIQKGVLTIDDVRKMKLYKYIRNKSLFENYDFNSVQKDDAEGDTLDRTVIDYINTKLNTILSFEDGKSPTLKEMEKWPTEEEMETWPDAVWKPRNKIELSKLISHFPTRLYHCNLNWIDISEITDMDALFWCSHFDGDISRWDVSNVTDMGAMFYGSYFNGDISGWNVSKVENMYNMFMNSEFEGDLSQWVKNGYITLQNARDWNIDKFIHLNDSELKEAFDFNNIDSENIEQVLTDDFMKKHVESKVQALYTHNLSEYPTEEEMETWPDAIWKPIQVDDVRLLMFEICEYEPLHHCNLNWIDMSGMSTLASLFYNRPFNGDISRWDVSNVTDMHAAFYKSKFNGDLSKWNVSKVADMSWMFAHSAFTGQKGDINGWDVSHVKKMNGMFYFSAFRGDISNWKPRMCFDCENMLGGIGNVIDLTKWLINGYLPMSHAKEWGLERFIHLKESFDFNNMYEETAENDVIDIEVKKQIDETVEKLLVMKFTYQPTAEEMTDWPDAAWKPENDKQLHLLISHLPYTHRHANLNWIDTSSITDMHSMFEFSKFNGDISRWDVSNVVTMKCMFKDSCFTGENGDISNWDVSNVKDMSAMFYRSQFNGDISNWDVSNVENMSNMFFQSKQYGHDFSRWVKEGGVTAEKARKWNIQPSYFGIKEAYDFGQVNPDDESGNVIDLIVQTVIPEKLEPFYSEDMDSVDIDWPLNEMNDWPDACYKIKNELLLYNFIQNIISTYAGQIQQDADEEPLNLNWLDTSEITSMQFLFESIETPIDISRWDVGKVTSMYSMFDNSVFNGDISNWDTSSVQNMSRMFKNSNFNGDISRWDVSNVKDMSFMFYGSGFNGDISNWEPTSVQRLNRIFYDSEFDGDLTPWVKNGFVSMQTMIDAKISWTIDKEQLNEAYDFDSVTQDDAAEDVLDTALIEYINEKVDAILQLEDDEYPTLEEMEDWPDHIWKPESEQQLRDMIAALPDELMNCNLNWVDTSGLNDMSAMFKWSSFNGDISRWNVSNVTDMSWTFARSVFNGDISQWDTSKVNDMESMFAYSNFKGDISNWDVSNVKNMHKMFYESIFEGDLTPWVKNGYITMKHADLWHIIKFIHLDNTNLNEAYDFDNIDATSAEGEIVDVQMKEYVADKVDSIIYGIERDYPTLEEMTKWPDGIWTPQNKDKLNSFIISIPTTLWKCNLNWIDVSGITDMKNMFYHSGFNGDISRWDVSNVTNMESMFSGSPFEGKLANWNVSNVRYMRYMFQNAAFNDDISKWDVHNVTDMGYMFFYANFNKDVSGWDLSSIKDMSDIFVSSNFKGDLTPWVINGYITWKQVTEWSLDKYIHLSTNESFDFNGVGKDDATESAFIEMEHQRILSVINKLLYDNGTDSEQFDDEDLDKWPDAIWKPASGQALNMMITTAIHHFGTKINLNWIDVSEIDDMRYLFFNSVNNSFKGDISRWDVSNVKIMECMFYGSHFNGDISRWDVRNVINMQEMFSSSKFNGDISHWNVSNVQTFEFIFDDAEFNGDLTPWVTNGYITMDDAKRWNLLKFINKQKLNESFNFNDIADDNAAEHIVDEIIKQNALEVITAIWFDLFNSKVDKIDASDLDNWPDSIWKPASPQTLKSMISKFIIYYGNNINLNWIDTSEITDMCSLFRFSEFDGDISRWDVSKVKSMECMFLWSKFNGDISNWDVSNVENMKEMFGGSAFNGDISKWNVGKVKIFDYMFDDSKFDGDLSNWIKKGYLTKAKSILSGISKYMKSQQIIYKKGS